MIDRIERWTRARSGRLRIAVPMVAGLFLVVGTVYASSPGGDSAGNRDGESTEINRSAPRVGVPASTDLEALEARVDRVTRRWAALDAYFHEEVAPLKRVLMRYTGDDALAGRVAAALVREGRAADLEPRLLLGVLLVENPWLDPSARSFVGAVGLMQVMPVHAGGWRCGTDLEDIDTNVCLGARVFAHYYQQTEGDIEQALLRYNGCVTGSNTPNCHQYPSRVLARAGTGSLVAWSGQGPSAGSP